MARPIPESYRAPLDLDALLRESPFLAETGMRLLSLGQQGAVLSLDITERHMNAEGRVHGGLLATLLDAALGLPARVMAEDGDLVRAVTMSLTVNYLAPPRGAQLCACGRLTGGGRSTVFAEGNVKDMDGVICATATGTFKRLLPRYQ